MTNLGRWLTGWAVASNERAVANARAASTDCSRRQVEREDVALFLATLAAPVRPETVAEVAPAGVDSLSG